jgi:iron complex transport system substrate-binding protein
VADYPSRIVCLTEETTETLYLIGEGDRVVGVSGYTVRPPEARKKPKVSAFINARFDKIDALKPDLVLAFSDLQADIARELIRRGYPVYTFNQRSVAEILQMIRIVGALVGRGEAGDALASRLERGLDEIRASAAAFRARPRVHFEEWDDPLISGIRWVEELVEIAGGDPIFPELRGKALGKDRIVDPAEVVARDPDVIVVLPCGYDIARARQDLPYLERRPEWASLRAVRGGRVYFADGNQYFNRPGPRVVESLEILAELLHPELFPARHRDAYWALGTHE